MVSPLDVVASSATPPATQSQSPFFKVFPAEIRRIVYEYYAYNYFAADHAGGLELLKACKRTALEGTAPMQKYARVTFLLDFNPFREYTSEDSTNEDDDSANEDEGPINGDEESVHENEDPADAGGNSANVDEEFANEENIYFLSDDDRPFSRWFGVHTVGSAHIAKVEHVFINLVIEEDDMYITYDWELAEDDPWFNEMFTESMPTLDAIAFSQGWDIKSVCIDLGSSFYDSFDRRDKFSAVKEFLEDGVISWVNHIPLFDRLVQQRAINFKGLDFSPFPIIESLNDPLRAEDENDEGFNHYVDIVMGLGDPRLYRDDKVRKSHFARLGL